MGFDGTVEEFDEFQRTRDELLARARQLGWYHCLQLSDTFRTPGAFDLDPYVRYYLPFDDLNRFDCLEIGSGNGYWAFALERHRARSVTTVDLPDYFDTDFSLRFGKESERPTPPVYEGAFGEPLRVAAVLLNSRLRYRRGSVYDLRPETHGRFGLVFCGSMLMHLFAPLLALQRMAAVCDDAFLLTTQTDLSLEPACAMTYLGHQIPYVHFVPSPTCLHAMVQSCGYERVLRGPTFLLGYAGTSHEDAIPQTMMIGLRDVERSALALRAAPVRRADARAAIEVVRPERDVPPGQPFDLIVRVRNLSGETWCSGANPKGSIRLTMTSDAMDTTRVAVADFLPAGVDTLVVLKCTAPENEGAVTVHFAVAQAGVRFQISGEQAVISVRHTTWRDTVAESLVRALKRLRPRP